MTTKTNTLSTTNEMPWLVGLGILAVIGIGAWVMQLVQGPAVLGTGQTIVWGVYIALFFLLAGTGSGLVVLTALGDLNVLPAFKQYRRALLISALATFVAAGVVILMDAGRPERVFNLIFSPNFHSMFVWDFYSLTLSVIVAAAYLYLGPKVKWLPLAAAVIASVLVVVEGLILVVSAAAPFWHTAILPVIFVAEGLITAFALVLLASNKAEVVAGARRWLAVLLATVFVLSLIEMVGVGYGANADALASLYLLTSYSLAILYWGQLLIGLALPFALLVFAPKNRAAVIVAAVLAFAGVFVGKLDTLVAGQAIPFMQSVASYSPSLVEVLGVVGMLGLAGFLFMIGNRYIPFKAEG
jgi:dimethyl sulfoxide reductase membrane subunit